MKKLDCLSNLVGRKIDILDYNFTVTMDSRKAEENTLFFGINKGNEYAKEAEGKGSFVIYDDKDIYIENGYLVEDTVKFMQEFAKEYRDKNDFIVIGITGSNGKTTVKDILYSVLIDKGEKVYKTQGNYNNHIGMPYTILSAKDEDKYLLLEMGMSALGEIDLLASIAKPDYSIITNIGQSHLEYLKTEENVFKAKSEIIQHTKKLVFVNGEDKYLSTLNGENIYKVEKMHIETNLFGEHNQINISIVKSLLEKIGYNNLSFGNIRLTSGRYQEVEGKYKYVNDAYNASPLSMSASISTFSGMYNEDYKIIVLGDMLELGDNEIKFHEDISHDLDKAKYDKVYLYGPRMKYLYKKLKKLGYENVYWFEDKEEIKKDINNIKVNKKITILLKGSRGMRMEDVMEGID